MSRRRRPIHADDYHDASPSTPPQRVTTASLILLGLILGLAGALYYAWVVSPIVYVNVSPARLSDSNKAEYLFLVSQAYALDQDWERAQRRLAAIDDPALSQTVTRLLEQYVREGQPPDAIRNMAVLARQLGAEAPAVALFAPTPLTDAPSTPTPSPTAAVPTATPSSTPAPTQTPRPTATAVPTSPANPTIQPTYRLLNQQRICPPDGSIPRIEVVTLDALLDPLPGVEVLVSWAENSDRFYTGFKPARGEGYGDFTMSPDISYAVVLADGSPEVGGLRIEPCADGTDGGWRLTFQNLILQPETPEPAPF